MAEVLDSAGDPFYWDYLQYTTEAILANEQWLPGKDHQFRIGIAPEVNDPECPTTFILHETRPAEGQPSEVYLDYQLCQTYAAGTPALTAIHRIRYDIASNSILTAHQQIKGREMSQDMRERYPRFVIPSHSEAEVPVQPTDYRLLSRGLTRIRRFAGIH